MKKKIAIVNQRYGIEINGGSEQYTRMLAEHLIEIYDIEILTTCALEHTTWKNYFLEGLQSLNGVPVRRFRVDKPRDINSFYRYYSHDLPDNPDTENEWIDRQGPVCTKLIKYIGEHKDEYDIFIFVTYLYYHTVRGIGLANEKAILIPTAHDEPYIRFSVYKNIFSIPKAIIFLTEEEKLLTYSIFHNQHILNEIIGMGVTLPREINLESFKSKYCLNDYIIYAGRVEEGKGCVELFDFFIRYKSRNPSNLKLILIGKAIMQIPHNSDIISLGFVSDSDKYNGMAGAKLLVQPSVNESLSIVVLESLALGIPIFVNGKSEVLQGHCRKSNAGLYYKTYNEFEGILNYLQSHTDIYSIMKLNGKKYVAENYNWIVVIEKFKKIIEAV
jgi:glycosyltransferase involved in cell wall biosynthesis